MASEFLRSSPARAENDDFKLNKAISATQTPASHKLSSIAFAKSLTSSTSSSSVKHQHQHQNSQSQSQSQQHPSQATFQYFPPSASKFLNYPTNLTGWTPLISKTYSNDQILSFNSTPNTNKWFTPSSLILPQNNQNVSAAPLTQPAPPSIAQPQSQGEELLNQQTSINVSNTTTFLPSAAAAATTATTATATTTTEYEYQSLGLTPFMNNNFNILGNTSGSGITPYQERVFRQNCEFYIESPIRTNNNIENFAITPSKFSLNSIASKKLAQDPMKSATKRNIALVDTPPRKPHKLSIITRAENDGESGEMEEEIKSSLKGQEIAKETTGDETDDEVEQEEQEEEEEGEEEEEEEEEEKEKEGKGKGEVKKEVEEEEVKREKEAEAKVDGKVETKIEKDCLLQTPCKKPLMNISNQLKVEFKTPANKKTTLSSPSTILLTSAKHTNVDVDNILENSNDDKENQPPPSPTPAKTLAEPIMGIFTEKKPSQTKTRLKKSTSTKFSKATNSNTHSNHINCSSYYSSSSKHDEQLHSENKSKMQAGMTKFQIVLTDFNAYTGKKKRAQHTEQKRVPLIKQQLQPQPQPPPPPPPQTLTQLQPPQLQTQSSSIVDNSIIMNSSREHSSILSLSNNSTNISSHFNLTMDHSSFESGGISSTPNSKVLLDRIFDKQSPQQMLYFQQQQHHHNYSAPLQPQSSQPTHYQVQDSSTIMHQQAQQHSSDGNMPPPSQQSNKHIQHIQHTQPPLPLPSSTSTSTSSSLYPIVSMMSTPQHSHVYNNQSNHGNEVFSTQIPSPWNFGFRTPPRTIAFSSNNNNINNNNNNNNSNTQFNTCTSTITSQNVSIESTDLKKQSIKVKLDTNSK
ncbi:hypothetical protein KGF56_000751 [Candida oxycetoniae]|uniref:Uncharacterized protein n=1 Tax=Candida oxycetoniae TaxID=497107 RepID=A0AAI9T123_9ASCO|nr:uncharacterized protein KGF56_000751 [Candida oxycetoniae]KAI3406271.2 hypothetical protein KGF56_000751 [Candida oxycetoniae]